MMIMELYKLSSVYNYIVPRARAHARVRVRERKQKSDKKKERHILSYVYALIGKILY